jgi:hypothetical protein
MALEGSSPRQVIKPLYWQHLLSLAKRSTCMRINRRQAIYIGKDLHGDFHR